MCRTESKNDFQTSVTMASFWTSAGEKTLKTDGKYEYIVFVFVSALHPYKFIIGIFLQYKFFTKYLQMSVNAGEGSSHKPELAGKKKPFIN